MDGAREGTTTSLPRVVSEDEWRDALERLRAEEKAATRARDALAAKRRRLPMVRIEKDGTFLDLTPLGRQEEWEDSPERYPQEPAYAWWRLHDEYGAAAG
jgi:predicted dithiol-disulfide oxidoreductase (DUF899 family)